MATINIESEKRAYKKFLDAGMAPAGACGLIGNLEAESDGFYCNRVEYLCLKRLKEAGKSYTDTTYTAAIDSGKLSCEEFLHPIPGKQYGYGLVQWTSPGRKAGLWNMARDKGVSIADEDMQLEYLLSELQNSYPGVLQVLKTAKNIREASDVVLKKFESPSDTSEAVCVARASRGQRFYDMYVRGENTMSKAQVIQKVIDIAAAEIGYLEKKSGSQLDEKTANAGSGNYTKYWRDVYPKYQGQAWCACFVSWVFAQAYGNDDAQKLLKHWPFVYCPTLAGMTSNTTPHKGDIVLFYRNGVYAHTGIVTSVTGNRVTTIEGNTNGASGIVANGGGVCRKTYQIDCIAGSRFFRPDYSIVARGPELKPGMKVQLTQAIAIRDGVSTKAHAAGYVAYTQLSESARKKSSRKGKKARLKSGTVVGILETRKDYKGDTWIRIKSGWLPVVVGGKYRVTEA